MKITGLWKVKKVGIFDSELGMQMKTVEEVYAMEDSEEVTQAKEMLETYLKVIENGTMRISMFVSEDIIAQAKAEGEEIPLNEDGSVSLQEMKWKEENGEIFYNLGDEVEIEGEKLDPWIKAEFDDDGLLVLTMMAFEKVEE